MPEEATGQMAPQQSFTERKAAQLAQERAAQPEVSEQPEQERTSAEIPEPESGSVQDDGYPELHDEMELSGQLPEDESDLDETPENPEDSYDDEEPSVDWEKRYKDTQAELTRVSTRREELDAEHAEMMASNVRLKHDLEDRLTQAQTQAGFFLNNVTGQIGQLEQAFNSGQIDPEHLPQARQAYQNLVQQRAQLEQYVEKAQSELSESEKIRKQREAEIARTVLARKIPDWSREKYDSMRGYASRLGYTPDEFNEVTDHRFFQLLNDSMLLHSAGETVNDVKRKKMAKPPRSGRNVDRQPRDGRGKFKKLERDFHSNPNERGRFAAMTEERLKRERRGR